MIKKYSKFILILLIMLSITYSFTVVSAEENNVYFTNENGVSLTKEEYDFLTKMYWDGYQKIMTQEEYRNFNDNDIMHGEFNKKKIIVDDNPLTRGSFHSTAAKSIEIATSCLESPDCFVSIVATWLGSPVVRSYDVMGCYLSRVSLTSVPVTRVSSKDDTYFTNDDKDLQTFDNGYGTSFKLPTGSNVIINQDFYVSKGGRVFASYQHAREDITYKVSKDYTISKIGYGGVFEFGKEGKEVYDQMNGVDIAV